MIVPDVSVEKSAWVAESKVENQPVEDVLLVVVRLVMVPVVPLKVVSVDEAEVSSDVEAVVAERLEIVVVAKFVEEVAVRVPTVRLDEEAFVRLV